eukprot:COSAG01_NODE_25386_length_746_cov_136.786708_1_plen_60_part_01
MLVQTPTRVWVSERFDLIDGVFTCSDRRGFRIDREVYWARMHGKLLQLSSMLECDPNPSW